MAFVKVALSLFSVVLVLTAKLVLGAPQPAHTTGVSDSTSTTRLQENLKLLLDITKVYMKLQVKRLLTTRNETVRLQQEAIVKELGDLLEHSSVVNNMVEEQGENASLPLLATKTLLDLSLNQSYHWLQATVGINVTRSSVEQTALSLEVQKVSQTLSRKLHIPNMPSSIDNPIHCTRIANTVMSMTDSFIKCHILRSVSPFCAYVISC